MRRFLLLAGLAVLAGCAYPSPARVTANNALIGKSEADLVRAMGVPMRTYETGGHKFLAFSEHHIDTIPGDPGPFWGGWGPYGWYGWGGGWGGFPPEVVSRDCETTFELTGGVVQRWTVRGNAC